MKDENYGYSLPLAPVTSEDIVRDLQETKKSYRRYTAFSFLEALAIPFVAEKCYEILPEPWNNTAYSGMVLLEIIAVGACLHSGYQWWKNSKLAGELEQKLR